MSVLFAAEKACFKRRKTSRVGRDDHDDRTGRAGAGIGTVFGRSELSEAGESKRSHDDWYTEVERCMVVTG
jgi:hypothetical protein